MQEQPQLTDNKVLPFKLSQQNGVQHVNLFDEKYVNLIRFLLGKFTPSTISRLIKYYLPNFVFFSIKHFFLRKNLFFLIIFSLDKFFYSQLFFFKIFIHFFLTNLFFIFYTTFLCIFFFSVQLFFLLHTKLFNALLHATFLCYFFMQHFRSNRSCNSFVQLFFHATSFHFL